MALTSLDRNTERLSMIADHIRFAMLTLTLVSGCSPPAPQPPEGAYPPDRPLSSTPVFLATLPVLADFEGEDALEAWTIQGAQVLIQKDWAAHGEQSLRVVFPATASQEWLLIALEASTGGLPTRDFSVADTLIMQLRNPTSNESSIRVEVSDTSGNAMRLTLRLAPLSEGTFTVPLRGGNQHGEGLGGVALDRVERIAIYTRRPDHTITFDVDEIRLANSLDERSKDYLQRWDQLKSQLETLQEAPHQAKSDWALKTLDLGALRDILERPLSAQQMNDAEEMLLRMEALPWLAMMAEKTDGQPAVLEAASTEHVHLHTARLPGTWQEADDLQFTLARHEYEHRQVVLIPTRSHIRSASWKVEAPEDADGNRLEADVRVVGYVRTAQPPYVVPFVGWWPDPLLPGVEEVKMVPLGETLTLWISIYAPPHAQTGSYQGSLQLTLDGKSWREIPLRAEVIDLSLPLTGTLPTVAVAQHERTYINDLYPDHDPAEIVELFEDFALKYKLSPTHMYQRNRGGWEDERLEALLEQGKNAFVLGNTGSRTVNADTIQAYNESKRFRLETLWGPKYRQISQAGFSGPVVICAYDEAPAELTDLIAQTGRFMLDNLPEGVIYLPVGVLDPDFGASWPFVPSDWVILLSKFETEADQVQAYRQRGGRPWLYTCLSAPHPYPMVFVEYDPIESRLLTGAIPWFLEVYGWVYYHLARWPENKTPLQTLDGRRTNWNPASYHAYNGSGSLIYGGPDGPIATIRLENLRDGLEDFEYYRLAQERQARLTLDTPAWPARLTSLYQATPRVRVASQVVPSLREWTRSPALLEAERARLINLLTETAE